MNERLRLESVYKVFGGNTKTAMELLRGGASKQKVLTETGLVAGLNDVSLSVPSGSIYMIMGLSGSGKSTLARCINRLNEPTSGKVLLDGTDLTLLANKELREVRRTRISMVFQHFALLPNRTVAENVEFGLKLRGVGAAVRRRKADEILNVVGLSSWSRRYPRELSGGMRQRVGLARALATDADVLIMDEAFSALDPLIRSEMQDELLRLQRTFQKTILFITHDFQEALKLGTRIAIMSDGQVVREGSPQDIVLDPQTEYVRSFTRDVDRARLLDATSAMATADIQMIQGERYAISGTSAIALDNDNRVLGHLSDQDLGRLRAGENMQSVQILDVQRVAPQAKLLELSGLHRCGKPLVVTDADNRFVGTVSAGAILAQISAPLDVPLSGRTTTNA